MKIIIVEDSRLARNELRELLSVYSDCEVIGEAANVKDAVACIDSLKPDVILLDIQLPDGDGFAVLEQLHHLPKVIFTTAYDQYALKAFEINALDYVLKPIEQTRLTQALDRCREKLVEPIITEVEVEKKSRKDQIFIKDGERCYFVKLAEVVLFEVEGNYTRTYFRDQRPLMPRALSYLDERLDKKEFFKANRQQIVNLDCVQCIEADVGDGLILTLSNKKNVLVSRRQAKELRDLLEL